MHDMVAAALAGDAALAQALDAKLEALHRDLFIESNPIPVKWAVQQMGLMKAGIRLPLTWLSDPCMKRCGRPCGRRESFERYESFS